MGNSRIFKRFYLEHTSPGEAQKALKYNSNAPGEEQAFSHGI
jgi:hypothetical protein